MELALLQEPQGSELAPQLSVVQAGLRHWLAEHELARPRPRQRCLLLLGSDYCREYCWKMT
jgi:hypothetical protein